MSKLSTHLRNKFLAGALTLVPILIVVIGVVWLEQHTQPLTHLLGLPPIPGLGVLIGLVGVYLLGVVVTSLIGGLLVRAVDYLLFRIPGLNLLYRTWKDVLLLPPGKASIYHQAVLQSVTKQGDPMVLCARISEINIRKFIYINIGENLIRNLFSTEAVVTGKR